MTRMMCPGSGKIVSVARRQRSIFVNGAWLCRCPRGDHAVTWAIAEARPDGNGYIRRFLDHPK